MVFNAFSWDNKGGKGPWGSAKGGGKRTTGQNDGRGNGPRRQQTPEPDLDDMIRNAQEKLRRHMGGGGGTGGGGFNKRVFSLGVIAAIAIWLASGFYIVDQAERGVVLRFGEYVDTTMPGLNYRLPWPIESVQTPIVERENRVEIGFRNVTEGVNQAISRRLAVRQRENLTRSMLESEALMLTGDENIVDLNFTVRWKIADAQKYLFNVASPDNTIKDVAESAMREIIGKRPIDDALTANRAEIELAAQDLIQGVMDGYGAGIQINAVELQQVNPPEPVIDSFKDVQAARADAEKVQNEAMGYANDIIPKARGRAAQIIQEAQAYRESRVLDAQGQADRFVKQLKEYQQAKEVTRQRMYIEAMEQVLGQSNVVVMSKGTSGNILPYLPLGERGQTTRIQQSNGGR